MTLEGQSQECVPNDSRSRVFQAIPGIFVKGHSWPAGEADTEGCGRGGRTQLLSSTD